MDKGDFNSLKYVAEFYKKEYKDINLEEFLDRMEMKWEAGELLVLAIIFSNFPKHY